MRRLEMGAVREVLRRAADRVGVARSARPAGDAGHGRRAGRFERARIVDALARGRCPACEDGSTSDETFFFWFFNESYLEPESVDRLTRSLGFCRVHGRLVELEAAKLACLEWELEEALRKSGWEYRPEAPGAEATAWRRALLKFSGSLPDGA